MYNRYADHVAMWKQTESVHVHGIYVYIDQVLADDRYRYHDNNLFPMLLKSMFERPRVYSGCAMNRTRIQRLSLIALSVVRERKHNVLTPWGRVTHMCVGNL